MTRVRRNLYAGIACYAFAYATYGAGALAYWNGKAYAATGLGLGGAFMTWVVGDYFLGKAFLQAVLTPQAATAGVIYHATLSPLPQANPRITLTPPAHIRPLETGHPSL